jgi:hypothetical protein
MAEIRQNADALLPTDVERKRSIPDQIEDWLAIHPEISATGYAEIISLSDHIDPSVEISEEEFERKIGSILTQFAATRDAVDRSISDGSDPAEREIDIQLRKTLQSASKAIADHFNKKKN